MVGIVLRTPFAKGVPNMDIQEGTGTALNGSADMMSAISGII
jgi:hypothetical protein